MDDRDWDVRGRVRNRASEHVDLHQPAPDLALESLLREADAGMRSDGTVNFADKGLFAPVQPGFGPRRLCSGDDIEMFGAAA
jgi:hypothetical protein